MSTQKKIKSDAMDILRRIINSVYGLPALHVFEYLLTVESEHEEVVATHCHIDIRKVRWACREMQKAGILYACNKKWRIDRDEAMKSMRALLESILNKLPIDDSNDVVFVCAKCNTQKPLQDCMDTISMGEIPNCCDIDMYEQKSTLREDRDELCFLIQSMKASTRQ
jgi:hypothetical protein